MASLLNHQQLVRREVGIGEERCLSSFWRDRRGGGNHVEFALGKIAEDRRERCLDELGLEAETFRDLADDVDVESLVVWPLAELEGWVWDVGTCRQHALGDGCERSGRGDGCVLLSSPSASQNKKRCRKQHGHRGHTPGVRRSTRLSHFFSSQSDRGPYPLRVPLPLVPRGQCAFGWQVDSG